MTYYNWPNNVNSDIFNMNATPVDATAETTFVGGRRVVRALNTRQMHNYSFSISLNVASGEYKRFYDWFDAIGGKAGVFKLPALGPGYFRFLDVPSDDSTSMQSRNVSLNVEELY